MKKYAKKIKEGIYMNLGFEIYEKLFGIDKGKYHWIVFDPEYDETIESSGQYYDSHYDAIYEAKEFIKNY